MESTARAAGDTQTDAVCATSRAVASAVNDPSGYVIRDDRVVATRDTPDAC